MIYCESAVRNNINEMLLHFLFLKVDLFTMVTCFADEHSGFNDVPQPNVPGAQGSDRLADPARALMEQQRGARQDVPDNFIDISVLEQLHHPLFLADL